METKFTEGEWIVEYPRNKKHYAKISGTHWTYLARVVVRLCGCRELCYEGVANTKLISAAPDMLDVCEELVRLKDLILPKHVDHIRDEHRDEIIALVRLVRQSEQAIRKATE